MKQILFLSFIFLGMLSQAWGMRLVSTSPAITDIVVELGKSESLVGISSYCHFPNKKISRIGTALSPDYEKIHRLKADLILMNETRNQAIIKNFKKLKVNYLGLKFFSLEDILESYEKVATHLGAKEKKSTLRKKVAKSLKKMPTLSSKQSFLIVINSNLLAGKLKTLYAAGSETYFHGILEKTQMLNSAAGKVPYPVWDREILLRKNPEHIFLIYPKVTKGQKIEQDLKAWKKMKNLKAVKKENIHVIQGRHAVIPGPQVVRLIEDFNKAFL